MDVVLDTTDLLPALVSRGRRRAFLTLCRYGRASLVHLTYSGVGFDSLAEYGEPAGPLAEVLEGPRTRSRSWRSVFPPGH